MLSRRMLTTRRKAGRTGSSLQNQFEKTTHDEVVSHKGMSDDTQLENSVELGRSVGSSRSSRPSMVKTSRGSWKSMGNVLVAQQDSAWHRRLKMLQTAKGELLVV